MIGIKWRGEGKKRDGDKRECLDLVDLSRVALFIVANHRVGIGFGWIRVKVEERSRRDMYGESGMEWNEWPCS